MKVAILHYHLNRGGVTQVVVNHLLALDALPDQHAPRLVLLVHGGRREGYPDSLPERLRKIKLAEIVVRELEYDEGASARPQPRVLADRIERSLRESGCDATDTLVHIHNHALGKNLSLPGAIRELAVRGFGLLLQLHDFAEDFRPAGYRRMQLALSAEDPAGLPGVLYPQASQIHFAVLNGRDLSVLRAAGVEVSRLHWLPNPVLPHEELADRSAARQHVVERFGIDDSRRYVLSPVRGIRRKNLGEALLWAAVVSSEAVFGFTLPPLNPREQPSYARWRALARELRLPCVFEVGGGGGLSLSQNFAACDRVLTTSVAEGFGFVFLEPCLAQRVLVGRDLPDITRDFVAAGMTFAGLKPRIDIPVDWLGQKELLDMWQHRFNSTLQAYGRPAMSRPELEANVAGKLRRGSVDFGDLNADFQERVLRKVCAGQGEREILLTSNPWLRDAIMGHDSEFAAEAEANAQIVRNAYALEPAGRHLSDIYRAIMDAPREPFVGAPVHGELILRAFLNLDRFQPVRL